jgi:hypothetical protein
LREIFGEAHFLFGSTCLIAAVAVFTLPTSLFAIAPTPELNVFTAATALGVGVPNSLNDLNHVYDPCKVPVLLNVHHKKTNVGFGGENTTQTVQEGYSALSTS